MDPFTLKPLDKEGIIQHAKAVGGKILTVEDHYIEGSYFPVVFMICVLFCARCCHAMQSCTQAINLKCDMGCLSFEKNSRHFWVKTFCVGRIHSP